MTTSSTERHARLDELASLESGWCDGEGKAMQPAPIEQARIFLDVIGGDPGIFANPDGFVQFEWLTSDSHVSIEFNTEAEDGGVFCLKVPR